jgi:hypothetical protein
MQGDAPLTGKDEEFRKKVMDEIPASYSPVFHLVFPSIVGVGLAALGIAFLRHPTWLELCVVPIMFVVSNATEWRMHKHVLHRRTPGMTILYDRHTPIHHRMFTTGNMSIRSPREFALVLIPPYGILLVALAVIPVSLLLFYFGQRNVAGLFLASNMLYTASYEWLHLSYHLPPESFIGRLWLVRVLKKHHATHHDPHLMQKWNFNVTIPLWDLVRGTIYREEQHPEVQGAQKPSR